MTVVWYHHARKRVDERIPPDVTLDLEAVKQVGSLYKSGQPFRFSRQGVVYCGVRLEQEVLLTTVWGVSWV